MSLKRILIAGEGGQGVQAVAKLLVESAFAEKKAVTFLPNFGVEQRGGVSLGFIQISEEEISFPKFKKADIVVVLTSRALKRIEEYFIKDTVLIFDNSLVPEADIKGYRVEKAAIPALLFAKERLVPKVFNMVILGAVAEEIGLSPKTLSKGIEKYFAAKIKKEPQLKHFNQTAFEMGYQTMRELKEGAKWRQKVLA